MKPSLQLKLSQHLALTPQLQQSIRLLQLSSLELQQEINQMLTDNPLLEIIEPVRDDVTIPLSQVGTRDEHPARETDAEPRELDGEMSQDTASADGVEVDSYEGVASTEESSGGEDWPSAPETSDDDERTFQQPCAENLRTHLVEQVRMLRLDEDVATLVRMLVEAVDDAGFLTITRDEMNMLICEASGEIAPQVSEAMWSDAIAALQSLDPTGVGARSLQECMLLQLQAMQESVAQIDAIEIVRDYYDCLTRKDSARIKRGMHIEDDDYKSALALIQQTHSRPGAPFGDDVAGFVVPDIIVKKLKRKWVAQLNPSTMPKLRINQVYANILASAKSGRTTPLSAQLQEARWLIRNVEQRFATILRVTQSIVERQQSFFEHGDIAMRPLTLREVADELELHESTISRVTSSKYMFTPRGVFELKYFFGSGVATDTGGSASATAIKAMIKQLIAAEDAAKPLTDNTLAELLSEQGVLVARRTVAKYREMLGIPAVGERKVA